MRNVSRQCYAALWSEHCANLHWLELWETKGVWLRERRLDEVAEDIEKRRAIPFRCIGADAETLGRMGAWLEYWLTMVGTSFLPSNFLKGAQAMLLPAEEIVDTIEIADDPRFERKELGILLRLVLREIPEAFTDAHLSEIRGSRSLLLSGLAARDPGEELRAMLVGAGLEFRGAKLTLTPRE